MDEDRGRSRQKHHEEKRMEVEERKRLIQEADQERKEAILRKNMERINNKVDGKSPKNASFVFGSSTPRTLNQELPSLESIASGSSRSTNPSLNSLPPPLNSVPPVLYRVRQQPVNMNSPADERPALRRVRPISAYASLSPSLSAVDQRMFFGERPVVHVKTSPSYDSQNAKACLMMTPEIHNRDNHNRDNYSLHNRDNHSLHNRDNYRDNHSLHRDQSGVKERNENQSSSINGDERDSHLGAGGDNMSQSLVFIQPSSGRKRHPELTPVAPKERGMVASMSRLSNRESNRENNRESNRENNRESNRETSNRRNGSATPSSTSTTTPTSSVGPRRAVSMTRLNELARPRQRYLEETLRSRRTPAIQQVNGSDSMAINVNNDSLTRSARTPGVNEGKERRHKKKVLRDPVVVSKDGESEVVEEKEKERLEMERKKKQLEERRKRESQERKKREEEERKREERKREEEERLAVAEEERLRKEEEEEARRLEEETIRLAEEHRKGEEEKLRLAIQEQERRQLEERKRVEEEARLAAEREEQELRAREEAEKARIELEERLRKDEEERLARKKRVEAIMSRTRKTPGKNGSSVDDGQNGDMEEQSNNETTTTTATSNGGSLNNFSPSENVSAF